MKNSRTIIQSLAFLVCVSLSSFALVGCNDRSYRVLDCIDLQSSVRGTNSLYDSLYALKGEAIKESDDWVHFVAVKTLIEDNPKVDIRQACKEVQVEIPDFNY